MPTTYRKKGKRRRRGRRRKIRKGKGHVREGFRHHISNTTISTERNILSLDWKIRTNSGTKATA
jgi:hypothetical protein